MKNLFTASGSFKLLASIFVVLISFQSQAQIDSLDVQVSSVVASDPQDANTSGYILNVDVFVDDLSDLGELSIIVFNQDMDQIVARLKMSKAELESANLINMNHVMKGFFLLEQGTYRVETTVRNSIKANLPKIITVYNI